MVRIPGVRSGLSARTGDLGRPVAARTQLTAHPGAAPRGKGRRESCASARPRLSPGGDICAGSTEAALSPRRLNGVGSVLVVTCWKEAPSVVHPHFRRPCSPPAAWRQADPPPLTSPLALPGLDDAHPPLLLSYMVGPRLTLKLTLFHQLYPGTRGPPNAS